MESDNSSISRLIQCEGKQPTLATPQASFMYNMWGITTVVMVILDITLNSLVFKTV